ncbi:MAG: uroporphyrinogen decarboxylase family protein [Acidobacteriota bacterium]
MMKGYPADWTQRTPAQKREYRLNRFLNPTNVEFVSPEAEKAYKIRAQRYVDAFNVKEPDRVPVNLPVGELPNILHGVSMHTAMYDIEKAIDACKSFNEKYSEELEYYAMPSAAPGKAMEILDYRLYAFPGHGLSKEAPNYQFVEGEYMKLEEYEDFFRDPSDFWLRIYLPRVVGAFEGFRSLPPLTDILEIPTGQIMALARPEVLEMLQKMIDAGKELQKRNAMMAQSMDSDAAHGFPSWLAMGVLNFAPFDAIGDTLRGTKSIMMDMFRNGDKLLKAIDIMTDILKKVMDALINEGLICMMFAEGSYNTRLEIVRDDFPKGSVIWWFDQTDMALAKKILGDKFAIQGNIPSSLLVTGSPGEVKACCRKLIETCGEGGGYILAAGCIAENPKLENLQAMMEAVREYGVYK